MMEKGLQQSYIVEFLLFYSQIAFILWTLGFLKLDFKNISTAYKYVFKDKIKTKQWNLIEYIK